MIAKTSVGISIVVILCFAGSFAGTVATRSQPATRPASGPCSTMIRELELDPEQAKTVAAHDPQFADDLRTLRNKLEEARAALAAVFEDESTTDEEIRRQVEAAIDAHNQLERRVAEYLIAVRQHLTPCQQRRLLRLCAKQVRQCGRRWRGGWGTGDTPEQTGPPCERPGRGRGHRRGAGPHDD